MNGVPVSSAPIDSNARIRMGPWSLRLAKDGDDNDVLQAFGERSFSALSVRKVSRQVDGRSLLDDVSFTVFSGEVVALVGPSGAGKTTLLNAISGVMPADVGEVLLDGQDFHQLLGLDRSLVGIVPQDDLVHRSSRSRRAFSTRADPSASDVTREEIRPRRPACSRSSDRAHRGEPDRRRPSPGHLRWTASASISARS